MPLTPLLGQLRRFVLERTTDPTGVSGTGVVAAGAQLIGGTCVFLWIDDPAASLSIFASAEAILAVHGHGGSTVIRWLDEAPEADPATERMMHQGAAALAFVAWIQTTHPALWAAWQAGPERPA